MLFLASPGDEAEHDAVRAAGGDLLVTPFPHGPGDFAAKINLGYRSTTEPLLFVGADDIDFAPGWFEAARLALRPGIGIVGTQDAGNPRVLRGEHATHFLVTRAYADAHGTIDGPGAVLHEGYSHNFCDTECVATAKSRSAWAFAHEAVVEHLHPHWSKGADDEVYRIGQAGFQRDRRLYQRRCRLWA